MFRSVLTIFYLVAVSTGASAQLWTENFDSYADGVTSGTAGGSIGGAWTSTVPGGGTFEKGSTLGDRFYSYQTGGEGVWSTSPIDISGTGRAIIEMNVFGVFVGGGDYIRCYYKVNGGPEILFFEQIGGLLNFSLTGSAIVTGNSLEMVVRSDVDGGITSFSFDDVVVTAVNTLYSRKSGDWNDVTIGNGTWSVAALGGGSCDCSPLPTDYLIIGNGNAVNINVAATAGGIEVRNTGTIQWTNDNLDLNVDRGILQVDVGGTINRNSRTGVQIDFDRGVITSVIINGTVTTEDIEVTAANATINISGSGSISLTDEFRIIADDIIINNDLTGAFTIGNDLLFDQTDDGLSDDALFVNNQTLTISSDILVGGNQDDENGFTNAAGATLNVGNINPADANFNFNNSGTVNQIGNFSGIVAASDFNNLATGIWNWTLTPNTAFDTDMTSVLDCSAIGNTFNYSAPGAQRIIPVQYGNLTLSNSGAKESNNASWSVNGNWSVTGAATFTEGTGTVTFNGTGTQTISNATGVEAFNNLTLNKASNRLVLSTSPSTDITIAGTMTFTSGIMTTTINESLTFNSGAAVSGGTSTSYVDGPVKKSGNTAFIFPTGYGVFWARIGIGSIVGGSATTQFTAQYISLPFSDQTVNATLLRVSTGEYWNLSSTGTAFTSAAVTLYWENGTRSGITSATTGNLRVARYNGTDWVDTGVGSITGTAASGTRTSPAITTANFGSYFTFGSNVALPTNPLPVELLEFNATLKSDIVELKWSTASELNNDFFTVERLNEDDSFDQIVVVKGSGTINEARSYQVYDFAPHEGKNYYRLKQIDFDGQFSYSKIVMVDFQGTGEGVNVYPNPTNQETITIEVKRLEPGQQVPLQIRSSLGTQTFSATYRADAAGSIKVSIPVEQWTQGLYLIQIGSDKPVQRKIIIE